LPDEYRTVLLVNPHTGGVTTYVPVQLLRDFDILDFEDQDPRVRRRKLDEWGLRWLKKAPHNWRVEPRKLAPWELERRRRRRARRLAADGDG